MKVFGWICFILGIVIAVGAIVSGLPSGRAGWNLGFSAIFTIPLIWRGWVTSHPKLKSSTCTNCGISNGSNYKFCGHCGMLLKR